MRLPCLSTLVASGLLGAMLEAHDSETAFVRVSPRDQRYLELSDGRPYVPIGLNLIHPDVTGPGGLERMGQWIEKLSANSGNYIRVWISSPFWDVEHERAGVYDEAKAARIDHLLELAREHGVRVKITIEHFRTIEGEGRQRWAHKPLHLVANGGTATNLADFFSGSASREQFKRKLAWFQKRYGDNPAVYGWELWNEVNAVATREANYLPWTGLMLAELHRLFPRNLAMQSLGSFDTANVRDLYRRHSLLPGNDVAQVHRYLDMGASLEVCHGPMDMLAAGAVRELIAFNPGRPIILAEGGAVEPRHTGPFKLYAKDKHGMLLHDLLFAPFFAGSAGAGQAWHWDSYVDRNDLWRHYERFAATIAGLDPPAESFKPIELKHPRLRIYALKGKRTVLLWCRDALNTWRTELEQEQAPELLQNIPIDCSEILDSAKAATALIYKPWDNNWIDAQVIDGTLKLPSFSRSLVVRFKVER